MNWNRDGKTLTVRVSKKLHSQMVIVAAVKHQGCMNECYEAAFRTYANLCQDDVSKALDANPRGEKGRKHE